MNSLEASIDAEMLPWMIAGGVVLVLLVYAVAVYNRLVKLRQLCAESFSDIDTELMRRHELIPNLINIVKGYAKHERELLESVTAARARAIAALAEVERVGSSSVRAQKAWVGEEAQLANLLGRMVVVAEAYPDLKANQNFGKLMSELSMTEDRIQAARRFFNANVREFNAVCEQFPSMFIARPFGFAPRPFFDIENPLRRNAVDVAAALSNKEGGGSPSA